MRSDWYDVHLIDEEIEAQEIKGLAQGHNPGKWRSQDSDSGSLSPKPIHTASLNSND